MAAPAVMALIRALLMGGKFGKAGPGPNLTAETVMPPGVPRGVVDPRDPSVTHEYLARLKSEEAAAGARRRLREESFPDRPGTALIDSPNIPPGSLGRGIAQSKQPMPPAQVNPRLRADVEGGKLDYMREMQAAGSLGSPRPLPGSAPVAMGGGRTTPYPYAQASAYGEGRMLRPDPPQRSPRGPGSMISDVHSADEAHLRQLMETAKRIAAQSGGEYQPDQVFHMLLRKYGRKAPAQPPVDPYPYGRGSGGR